MSEPAWVGVVAALVAGIITRVYSGWQSRQQIETKTAPRIRREAKEDLEPAIKELSFLLREAFVEIRQARESYNTALLEAIKLSRPKGE